MPLNTPNAQDSPTYAGQAVVDKTDLAAIANVAQGYGVVSGCLVSAGGAYNVNVASGVILVAGVQVPVSAVTALAPAAASSTDRRDIVVASTAGAVSIVSGTPTTETAIPWTTTSSYNPPVKPAIPAGSVLLAEIYIPGGGGTIVTGWITDKTLTNPYLTGVGAQTAIRTAANQDLPRRGGNVGVATSVDASASFPYGQIEVVIGDSIAAAVGASSFGKTDWPSILANQENRLLGLPDAGIGYVDAYTGGGIWNLPGFSTVGASCVGVAGMAPEVNNAPTGVQLGAAAATSTAAGATNSLTDNRVFNRALVFYKPGAAYDNIGVSVQGQNGATYATINTTAASTPGNLTVSIYDTGVIASPTVAPTMSMFRVTRGGTAPIVYGVLYYAPGVTGTSGLSMLNLAAGGTESASWTDRRTWESALAALGTSIRRVHIRLGGNDVLLARVVGDAVFNNSTTLTSATATFTPGDVGSVILGTNIPAGTTITAVASTISATMSAAATGAPPAAVSITAASAAAGNITFTATNAYASGQRVILSGLTGGFGVLNGTTQTIIATSLSVSQFLITNAATGTTTTGTASPAYIINSDVYGLTMDQGLHFGDSTNSSGRVDGQRAHADEIWERLGYAKAIPVATPGLVTLTSGTNWLCPTAGTYLVSCVAGGGGGGGGGSTTTASGTATGGGGGGSGATATGILSLAAGTLYPYSLAAAASGGAGGAAAGTNAGTAGTNGNVTTFGSGPLVRASGGGAGSGGAVTNATQNINGGCYGYPGGGTSLAAGVGGIANLGGFVPVGGGGSVAASGGGGGAGGNGGATNLGGTGGATGTAIAGGAAGVTAGAGTAAGTAGGAAGVTAYGAGGGGGGGGNNSLAGGGGGAGAPGVIYIQKVG